MGVDKRYRPVIGPNGVAEVNGSGMPLSGTSSLLANRGYKKGSIYTDYTNGVRWINEGSTAAPYWSLDGRTQEGVFGIFEDFDDETGVAVAGTSATAALASGARIHGQGSADTDSGLVITTGGEGGSVGVFTTTNEAAHTIAISTDAIFQPDQHGGMILDFEAAQVTALTDRAFFGGFVGTAADAMDPRATGATVTLTLVDNDLAGIFQDSGLTDADGFFAPHNKSNEAATLATTATGVDLSTTMAAAGTYQRFRVVITSAGTMQVFVDKALKTTIASALDVDEEMAATVYLESNAAAIKTMNVRRFAAYAYRA